ncbi:Spindle and kinetochore-associated protein 1 [Desmophyllum pertusum]|uniref:Spindle and kinetochore-associated protein 1 n=1 Tax=Desmophyllum pertusum TaxID=174260 RepID=A0A9W9Y7F6_9CNID|nr:Spindle and kinetochore-associated protein 1 [Desmophyllum pertusum]
MAEAPAPGVQFPQPLVNPPAQGPQVPQVAQAAQVPQAAQVAQAAQVPQAVQVAQAAQVLPAAQGVPVPQAAQAAGQNAAQNVLPADTTNPRFYTPGVVPGGNFDQSSGDWGDIFGGESGKVAPPHIVLPLTVEPLWDRLRLQYFSQSAVVTYNLALKLKMASTLEEMAALFATKTSNLKRCMELRSAGNSTNCDSVLRSIDKELLEIEAALDGFQAHVEKEKMLLEQGEKRVWRNKSWCYPWYSSSIQCLCRAFFAVAFPPSEVQLSFTSLRQFINHILQSLHAP